MCESLQKQRHCVLAFTQKQLIYYLTKRQLHTHPRQSFQAVTLSGQQHHPPIQNCPLLLVSVKTNNREARICSLLLKENYMAQSRLLKYFYNSYPPPPRARACSSDMASQQPSLPGLLPRHQPWCGLVSSSFTGFPATTSTSPVVGNNASRLTAG